MPRTVRIALPLVLATVALAVPAADVRAAGTWTWPVVGPVIRAFDPPQSPFGSGHRGIDIAAAYGTPVRAPAAGTVSFAGQVGGQLFVSVDHGGGLVSSYSWLSVLSVRRGDAVLRGSVLAATGLGHAGSLLAHLHFGVRLNGEYVDPLGLLSEGDVSTLIRLAPLIPAPPAVLSFVVTGPI